MKEHNFRRQKYQKSDFYQKKKLFKIDDIDAYKILVSRKEPCGQNNSFKYLLDTMIIMLLDHYVYGFHKWQAMLENLMKMQQCLLELTIGSF